MDHYSLAVFVMRQVAKDISEKSMCPCGVQPSLGSSAGIVNTQLEVEKEKKLNSLVTEFKLFESRNHRAEGRRPYQLIWVDPSQANDVELREVRVRLLCNVILVHDHLDSRIQMSRLLRRRLCTLIRIESGSNLG